MMRAVILLVVFLAGASLMSLEMAGFRLITPDFGSTIAIWGAIITVFLMGLAVGAFAGGRLADRHPSLWKLGAVVAIAGLGALTLPLYAGPVLDALSGKGAPLPAEWYDAKPPAGDPTKLMVFEEPDLKWAALGAGIVLFAIPSVLLGMVSPYAARLLIRSMPKLGSGVGLVSALSTVGSILGTLGTAFTLIERLGTRGILATNGLVLVGLGILLGLTHLVAGRSSQQVR